MSAYRDDFVQALRQGRKMRGCMFSVLEERHATDFADIRTGSQYYTNVLEAVRAANVPEALEEFQSRFLPLLDSHESRLQAVPAIDPPPSMHGHGRWIAAASGAMVLLAGAIFGLNALP